MILVETEIWRRVLDGRDPGLLSRLSRPSEITTCPWILAEIWSEFPLAQEGELARSLNLIPVLDSNPGQEVFMLGARLVHGVQLKKRKLPVRLQHGLIAAVAIRNRQILLHDDPVYGVMARDTDLKQVRLK